MSRIDYYESDGPDTSGLWFASMRKGMRGARGQAALRELEAALLALPERRLIEDEMCDGEGVCAAGALLLKRATDRGEDRKAALDRIAGTWGDLDAGIAYRPLAKELGIGATLAWAIMEVNDEDCGGMEPEDRYAAVLDWVRRNIAA